MTNKEKVKFLQRIIDRWYPSFSIFSKKYWFDVDLYPGLCGVMQQQIDSYVIANRLSRMRWETEFPGLAAELTDLKHKRDDMWSFPPGKVEPRRKFLKKWIKYYKSLDR